jgi:CMP-N,N'-diacetyllegionaminic acid synthase
MQVIPTFTAIIPVRAGSKGIPGKNLWSHNGVSLLARAIRLGFHLRPWVERVIVSTDSIEMQAIALGEGAECLTLRPATLATDKATSIDVVRNVIESHAVSSQHILLLQATSPLRRLADGEAFISAYLKSGLSAATSVVKLDEPRPEKLKRFVDGRLRPYLDQGYEGPRQTLPQPYALNGAFYAIRRDIINQHDTFLPEDTLGFEMLPEQSHNLDSPQDMQILSAMLVAGTWQLEDLPRL